MAFTLFRRRKKAGGSGATGERARTQPHLAAAIIAGRRHMTDVPYALPKDLAEVNRLDFQHYI